MPPNNPMTEGEALDAALEAWDDVYDGVSHNKRQAMRAALAAHTAASGGEVAWRDADTAPKCPTITDDEPVRLVWHDKQGRKCTTWTSAKEIAGWKHPPAAVPADALERLAEKWRRDSVNERDYYADALRACADELAALIPKGADHGQR